MKSPTDLHWNERAASVEEDVEVNIMDIFQRELEYDRVLQNLREDMTVLEVGCGNGFSTNRFRPRVRHVDAFDYSEAMIERARSTYGETNNRFLHDDVLAPQRLGGPYDAVICVRVLINLRDLEEQRRALSNLKPLVGANGLLILVEGFRDGFERLSALRTAVGLPPLEPARINFYSALSDLVPELTRDFAVEEDFHLGAYDYLTRVVYPVVAGHENVRHNTVFSERCSTLARAHNPECFREFSRIHGLVLRRR